MQVISFPDCCVDNFGIFLRSSSAGGYDAGVALGGSGTPLARITTDYFSVNSLSSAPFDPGKAIHTYRAEVKGNTIKLSIDNNPLASTTDNQFLDPGQVGLYSDSVQLEVISFKVTAL